MEFPCKFHDVISANCGSDCQDFFGGAVLPLNLSNLATSTSGVTLPNTLVTLGVLTTSWVSASVILLDVTLLDGSKSCAFLMCWLHKSLREYVLLHNEHWYLNLSLCSLLWRFQALPSLNVFPQTSQLNGRSPV